MRSKLRADGFETRLETFYAEVPQPPTKIVLQLLENPIVDFDLRESPIHGDPDGTRKDAGTLPFTAWSGSGNVTAALVNAGHGLRGDYTVLSQAGIPVRGRIALIAYGANEPIILAQRAQRRGALGVIFWSDPNGPDGSRFGPAYPQGPYRPNGAVRRAAVGPEQLQIPTLPISANAGSRLLQSMNGRVSDAPVHLLVKQTQVWESLWNTVGTLVGTDPSHTVVLGARRDAWVFGATNDGSGISTLLETAHALGYLYRGGWRPRYTIVIAGWDGGSVGNLGSAQYVRDNFRSIFDGCIAYIDAGTNATGEFFAATASAPLHRLIPAAAQRIADPRDHQQTLYDRWEQQSRGVHVSTLNGGSDSAAFLNEAGVPVLFPAFLGPFGVGASGFDDVRYAATQADPGFVNHRALAQLMALLTFQLANGALPYQFTPYMAQLLAMQSTFATHGATNTELALLSGSITRFAHRAASVDAHGIDPNYEVVLVHRLDRFMTHPGVNAAQAARTLDDIDASLH